MNFSFEFIANTFIYVLKALPLTLLLTIIPMALGILIGFVFALVRIAKIPILNQFVQIYVSFFRSIPLLVLLFIAYYGTPKLINFAVYGGERVLGSINMSSNVVAFATITLYSAAFLCEIIRGAFSSVDFRQMEAAHSLGMTKLQGYFRIIIPQALIVAYPNFSNFFLALLKGTSVVFTISVIDIMSAAKLQAEEGYRFIEAYVLVGAFYIVLSLIFSQIFRTVEKKAKYKVGIAE